MDIIKFCGTSKEESSKKAIMFYYDNLEGIIKINDFWAKCKLQSDKKTIHYYHRLTIDEKKEK